MFYQYTGIALTDDRSIQIMSKKTQMYEISTLIWLKKVIRFMY